MSDTGIDRYEVEAMIRDAGYGYASRNDLADVRDDLHALGSRLAIQIDGLTELLAGLTQAMHALHIPGEHSVKA